jgi:hypothetical protein
MSDTVRSRLDRRSFLVRSGAAAAGTLAAPLLGAFPQVPTGLPRHWAWVHGGRQRSGDQWRERFALARRSGLGGVLVSGGETSLLAGAARAEGLAFHRWIWTLNRSGDDRVKADHPEWFSTSRRGESCLEKPPYVGYYQWLCPSRPEVRAYLADWAAGIAADPEVEGIHLDYIRHPDVILPVGLWSKYGLVQDRELPEYDFCYCEVCRSLFRARTGTDPLELPDPAADERWRRFRWAGVTGVVEAIAGAVRPTGKPLSAAVFPTPTIARRLVRQAWEDWPLQAVFPMLYHRFYEEKLPWIGDGVREGVAALAGRFPLQAGLYVPDLPPEELARAVRLALAAGAQGISLFELDALRPDHWTALADVLKS